MTSIVYPSDMKLEDLKKVIPFQWRVQSASQYGAQCVAYIDSRDVQDLLDIVCGQDAWQCRFEEHKGNLFCSIGIRSVNGEWVWKSDCGTESNIEKQKGEASDSFKRASVMWGVGRFLYNLPIISLPTKQDDKGKWIPFSEKSNKFVRSGELVSQWCNKLMEEKNGK